MLSVLNEEETGRTPAHRTERVLTRMAGTLNLGSTVQGNRIPVALAVAAD
jgi:hypothetical protein